MTDRSGGGAGLKTATIGDDEILTRGMLAEALLAQGDRAGAENEIRSGRQLLKSDQKHSSQVHDVGVRFGIAESRLLAVTRPADAASALQILLKEANRRQYLGQQFQIRLAAGEIEFRSANQAVGREHLSLLAKEAQMKGFALIASQAKRAGGS